MNIKKQVIGIKNSKNPSGIFLNFPLGNKKAQEGGTLTTIRTAILVIIVIIVLIFLFTRWIGREGGILSGHIDSLGDCDFDGVANLYDRCACDPGDEKFSGCDNKEELEKYKNDTTEKSRCKEKMQEYYRQKPKEREGDCKIEYS